MSVAATPVTQRLRLGGLLFLVSLSVFFVAGMLLYVFFAYARADETSQHTIPVLFLQSTVLLVLTSGALVAAHWAVRRERHRWLLGSLLLAFVGGLAFILVQSFAMKNLIVDGIQRHGTAAMWGMVVTLVILHALHVAGGMIGMGMVLISALRNRYDHEFHWPVDFMGTYWHFLDFVWITMLATFWWTSAGFQ